MPGISEYSGSLYGDVPQPGPADLEQTKGFSNVNKISHAAQSIQPILSMIRGSD